MDFNKYKKSCNIPGIRVQGVVPFPQIRSCTYFASFILKCFIFVAVVLVLYS